MTLSKRIQAFKCKHDHHKWAYSEETWCYNWGTVDMKMRTCLDCHKTQYFHPVTYGIYEDYPTGTNPTKTGTP